MTAEPSATEPSAAETSTEPSATGPVLSPPAGAEPHILEIRVHGVANTPPASMLGLEPDQIVRSAGDSNGSFWTPAAGALEALAASPLVDALSDHRIPPPGVRREAYSWGALARLSTLPGLSAATGVVNGVIRALWVLIIPFGLTNAAYWARNLDSHQPDRSGQPARPRHSAGGSALVRMFGLLLTLLWTATAATLTIGVVGAQCYVRTPPAFGAGPGAGLQDVRYVLACAALPDQVDALARWTVGQRVAVLGLVALVAVLALALVASTGSVRFDRHVSPRRAHTTLSHATNDRLPGWPMLTKPGFWDHWLNGWLLWLVHLAAAVSLLTFVLAWQFVSLGRGGWWSLLVGSVLIIAFSLVRVAGMRVEQAHVAGERVASWLEPRWIIAVSGLSLAMLVGCLVAVARSGETLQPRTGRVWELIGLDYVVPCVIATMTLLIVAAAGARTIVRWGAWAGLVAACLGAGLLVALPGTDAAADGWLIAAALVVLAAFILLIATRPSATTHDRRREGWRGRGPAVFLALAGGFALVLTSAVVAATVAWLEAPAAAERMTLPLAVTEGLAQLDADALRDPVVTQPPATADVVVGGPTRLSIPLGYDGFAAMSLIAVAVFVLALLVLALRTVQLRGQPLRGPVLEQPAQVDPPVLAVRRYASLAHRAEPIVGWLALSLWLAMGLSLFVRPFSPSSPLARASGLIDLWPWLESWSTGFVLLAFGFLVTSVVVGGGAGSVGRPWGLLWDLTCFLPRVAHPFAAPCYAERAVPELRSRIDEWLGVNPGADERAAVVARERAASITDPAARAALELRLLDERRARLGSRRVVVAAHSLGAVVAVSTVFARWQPDPETTYGVVARGESIALLTCGTQLRSHFGRFFPELFGPDVLGTEPNTGPKIWAPDPWLDVLTTAPEQRPRRGSLVGFLCDLPAAGDEVPAGRTPRWRGLWRRTDFLGFPVDSYGPTTRGIDHYEAEVDETAYLFTIATHGGDHRTPEYRHQLLSLIAAWRPT